MPEKPPIRPMFTTTMVALLVAACTFRTPVAMAQDRSAPAPKPAAAARVLAGPWTWREPGGESHGGTVERIDAAGISWREGDEAKPERVSWDRIEELRRNDEPGFDTSRDATPGPMILLPEHDKLKGEAVATLTQGLAIESASIGIVNLPLAQWAGVLSLPPNSPGKFLRTIETLRRGSETPGDLVLLANGDRMLGTVIELDADNLKLQPTGAPKPVTLPRSGVLGLAIDASTLEYPPFEGTGWKVLLTDGSRISARAISYDREDPEAGLNVSTRWGSEWRVPVAKLAQIRTIAPGTIELDMVKPAAVQTVEYVGPTASPRFGANVQGGPLRIGPRVFDQGIGTQSRTLMAYRLDGTRRTFTAWVGLDSAAGPKGQARAVVMLDGKPVFDSGPLKAGEPPRRVQIDLGSARLLILASEFGDGGGVRDWVNWCEPVIRP